jgi:thermitase
VAEAVLDAVAAGAQVINMSFGTTEKITSKLLQDAIHEAQSKGVVVVGAAGNDGDNKPDFPAAQPSVLSVAALDDNGALARFSNWGHWVAVAAPGDDLVGPMPGGGYATWSGTSMATPLVSGQVAILRSANPSVQANKVIEAVEQTATKLSKNGVHFGAIDLPASLDYVLNRH